MLRQHAKHVFGGKGQIAIGIKPDMTENLLRWAEAAARRDHELAETCRDELVDKHAVALSRFFSARQVQSSGIFKTLNALTIDWDRVFRATFGFNPLAGQNGHRGMLPDARSTIVIPLNTPVDWEKIKKLMAHSTLDTDADRAEFARGAVEAFRIALAPYTDEVPQGASGVCATP